ncbi:hypothetical protein [Streptomyces olindensis]|uniref:hypothetical protein n=1 Tax=Streptomyces olindensis TaxID=358823 RepID=UPI0033F44669
MTEDGEKQRIAASVTEVDGGEVSYDHVKLDGGNRCLHHGTGRHVSRRPAA